MQWVLILLMFGMDGPYPSTAMTGVSGFMTYDACVSTGEAWKKTKHEYQREYECLPATASK